MPHEIRTTQVHVLPEGAALFAERAFQVEISGDAAGEYVIVIGEPLGSKVDGGKIAISPHEWPALRRAINKMMKDCREFLF